jgi:hypothetical protein
MVENVRQVKQISEESQEVFATHKVAAEDRSTRM